MKICYKSGSADAPNSTDDFDDVLKAVAQSINSGDKIFDFSGSDFSELPSHKIGKLFEALGCVSQPYIVKFKGCKFNEKDQDHISQLTLGFSSTRNLVGIELINSFSEEQTICDIALSLSRNHNLKSLKMDGSKVTPPIATFLLKTHPTAIDITVDGLVAKKTNDSQFRFFQSGSVDAEQPVAEDQVKSLPKQKNN